MVRNNVHRLIWLDIASAVAVGVTTIVDEKFDLIVPLTGLALLFLLVLGGVNVVAIFLLWKKQPSRSFLPFAIYICCVVVMFYGVRLGIPVVMANTLVEPDTFLNGQVRSDLEDIARQLRGHDFKNIFKDHSGMWTIQAVDGRRLTPLRIDLLNQLNGYNFRSVSIDDTQSLVVFGGYHQRTWYRYLYSASGLEPAYLRPSTITELDIESWSELHKIVRQGSVATECDRMKISFEPSIAYSTLEGAFDETALVALRETGDVTSEEKPQ